MGASPGCLKVRFSSSLTLQITRREGRDSDEGGHITALCCTHFPMGCGGAAQGSISGTAGASQQPASFASFGSLLPNIMVLLLGVPLSLLSHRAPSGIRTISLLSLRHWGGGMAPPLEAFVSPQRREWPAGCCLSFKNCLAFPSPPRRRRACLFPGVHLRLYCGLVLLCREMCKHTYIRMFTH